MTHIHINRSLCEFKFISEAPSIPKLLDQGFRKCGFAGPTDLPHLAYLVLMSGVAKRPASLLIKGPSGAGKSFALNTAKRFIPGEAFEEFSGMSEKALVYLKGLNLKHRHLIIGEAAGMAKGEGRTLLRQLLSEDRVRYATVQSTDKGMEGKELPTLEGPTGLVMTTTASTIHPEDESRMISVNIEESGDQLLESLLAAAGRGERTKEEVDLEPWHAFYRFLKDQSNDVVIPFSGELARRMPTHHHRIRRDFKQLLTLIETSALMHQMTRDRNESGAVVASLEDYAHVRRLVNKPMSEGISASVSDPIRAVVEAVKEKNDEGRRGLSHTEIAQIVGKHQTSVTRALETAIDEGYLENRSPGQGKKASIFLGDRDLPSDLILPDPKELDGAASTSTAKDEIPPVKLRPVAPAKKAPMPF